MPWSPPVLDPGFLLALEASPSGMLVVDAAGRIVFANAHLGALLGHGADELVGHSVDDLVPPGRRDAHARHRQSFASARQRRPMGTGLDLRARHRDGAEIAVTIGLNPFEHQGHELVLCSVVDARPRRALEQARQSRELIALEAQRLGSLGHLASGVAHDFNNLLVAVLGNARLAQTTEPAGMVGECLDDIALAAEHASELSRQLLLYAGKPGDDIELLDVSTLVRDMTSLLRALVRHRADLRVQVASDLPQLEGDATQLRQVLLNLVGNAVDALEASDGGVVYVSTGQLHADADYLRSARPQGLSPGTYLTFEVSDTGIGIAHDRLDTIFEAFCTTKADGHGLGLAASLRIIEAHGGGIIPYSEPGRGTTMKVLLPASTASDHGLPPTPHTGRTRTVLVVDDNEMVRRFTRRCLAQRGYQVLEADDGADALRRFHAHRGQVDLVILDRSLPEVDGDDAFREIRTLDPEARVLLTSGFNEAESTASFGGKGLAGFLAKPFTQDMLFTAIDRAIGDD